MLKADDLSSFYLGYKIIGSHALRRLLHNKQSGNPSLGLPNIMTSLLNRVNNDKAKRSKISYLLYTIECI